MAVEDGAMVTASLEQHLGENLRSLVLDTSVESETEYGSVRSAQVLKELCARLDGMAQTAP